jgi:hypothetical protein
MERGAFSATYMEDEEKRIEKCHTSTALVPLSIKSSFVKTPKVLSP